MNVFFPQNCVPIFEIFLLFSTSLFLIRLNHFSLKHILNNSDFKISKSLTFWGDILTKLWFVKILLFFLIGGFDVSEHSIFFLYRKSAKVNPIFVLVEITTNCL